MKCGDTLYVWDYANEVAVPEAEMPLGSERFIKSAKAKMELARVGGKLWPK